MECYCFLRNAQDLSPDGKTPYERRFGEPFTGPKNPFGIVGVNIARCLRKTTTDSTRLVKRSHQASSMDVCCIRTASGKEISSSRTLRSWSRWTRQKFMLEDSVQSRFSCQNLENSHSLSFRETHVKIGPERSGIPKIYFNPGSLVESDRSQPSDQEADDIKSP